MKTTSRFKIRFVPTSKRDSAPNPCRSSPESHGKEQKQPQSCEAKSQAPAHGRSRSGCRECKRRRVRCDETFPVCLRCQRRGSICESIPRLRQWQIEAPWLQNASGGHTDSDSFTSVAAADETTTLTRAAADRTLLRYWLEKASQIMVIDPDINPLSFPILEHVNRAPSLIHTLQSVGAAHQQFFDPSKLARCLEERSCALNLVQKELTTRQAEDLFPVFLTVFVLGLSTAWINGPGPEWGYEHLRGARALINLVLHQTESPPFCEFMVGAYLYWDMACAFLVPSHLHEPLNTPEMFMAVTRYAQQYHPIGGYTIEMFYLLGNLGRYCRMVVDTGIRDPVLEATFEEQLTEWEPNRENTELGMISDAFRYHGLINLHAICYRRQDDYPSTDSIHDDTLESLLGIEPDVHTTHDLVIVEETVRNYALLVVRNLTQIPSSHPCTNLQAIPLLTAGSELTAEDCVERELVRQRFQAMYSLNHLRSNLASLNLLEELWALRDAGQVVTWIELMLNRGWLLMLG